MTKVKDSLELDEATLKHTPVYKKTDLPLIKERLKQNILLDADVTTKDMTTRTLKAGILLLDQAYREMLFEDKLTDDEFLIVYNQILVFKQLVSDRAARCPDLLDCSKIQILLYGYKISTDECDIEATVFLHAEYDNTIKFYYNCWYELDKDAVTSELYESILAKTKNKTKLTVEEHSALIEYFIRSRFLPQDYSRDQGLNERYEKIKAIPTNFVTIQSSQSIMK